MAVYHLKSKPPNSKTSDDVVLLRFMLFINYIYFFEQLRIRFKTNNEMFLFLINKYIKKFQELSEKKTSSIKIYQTSCKQYQQKTLRINKMMHQILKDISDMTGYSISYVIRLIIEWEWEELQRENDTHAEVKNYYEMTTLIVSTISKLIIYHTLDLKLAQVREIIKVGYG